MNAESPTPDPLLADRQAVPSPASTPQRAVRTPRRTTSRAPRGAAGSSDLSLLNGHPLNQHALALLPKWSLRPDAARLHLLTLISPIGFASKREAAMLRKMNRDWQPSAVIDYFSRLPAFPEFFLAQKKPLEAVHTLLAAVDLVAEPQRFLPPLAEGLTPASE